MKTKKKITMEGLAGMVQRGFLDTAKKSDLNIVKADLKVVKNDVAVLKKDVDSIKEDFRKILNSLDKVAKQYADYLEEMKSRDAEVKRLKRWIEQIAQKVGIELV